jgi:hypothetical protein
MPGRHKTAKQYLDMFKNDSRQLWFGEIMDTVDETRNGRMLVYIPDITGTDKSRSALFDCEWTSPFAGATYSSASTDPENAEAAQTSYGMWMRPPDPGTRVVVGMIMIRSIKRPVILGCFFHTNRNFMVPGIPIGTTPDRENQPVTEINMDAAEGASHNIRYEWEGDAVTTYADIRPRSPFADVLYWQGLYRDSARGRTTSGARREPVSEVFGILTPGSRKSGNPAARNPGHQFVMDDNDSSQLIRLRTGKGMQLLLNDTDNIIYIINRNGTGYVEIDGDGNIDMFGKGSFNVRTMGDLNLRADQNINIEAGQDVNIKAANNAPHPFDIGRALGGIVDDIDEALMHPIHSGTFVASNNKGRVNIEAHADFNLNARNIKLNAKSGALQPTMDGEIHMMSTGLNQTQAPHIYKYAVGGESGPGQLMLYSSGPSQLRGTEVVVNATTKLDLEAPAVDIATSTTPAVEFPVIKVADYINTSRKHITLFGYDQSELPGSSATNPWKQVQGKSVTGLGPPAAPGQQPNEPIADGMGKGGVKTILTRIPQPEPSKSKKDKPLTGGLGDF